MTQTRKNPAPAVAPVACIQHFNGDKGRLFFIEDVSPPPGSDSYIDDVTWTLLVPLLTPSALPQVAEDLKKLLDAYRFEAGHVSRVGLHLHRDPADIRVEIEHLFAALSSQASVVVAEQRAAEMTAACREVAYDWRAPEASKYSASLWCNAIGQDVVGVGPDAWAAVQAAHTKRQQAESKPRVQHP